MKKILYLLSIVFIITIKYCPTSFAESIRIKVTSNIKDFPSEASPFFLFYDPSASEININVIQTATLTVVICEEDSGSVLTVSSFPPVAGNPNQTYVVAAPISPGTYDIFLSMDGYSCLGSFVVE